LVYILFNIYIHVSKYNLILYTYIFMYINIYIYSYIHAYVCVLYSVCVRAFVHTQNQNKEMKAWHNLRGATWTIYKLSKQ